MENLDVRNQIFNDDEKVGVKLIKLRDHYKEIMDDTPSLKEAYEALVQLTANEEFMNKIDSFEETRLNIESESTDGIKRHG